MRTCLIVAVVVLLAHLAIVQDAGAQNQMAWFEFLNGGKWARPQSALVCRRVFDTEGNLVGGSNRETLRVYGHPDSIVEILSRACPSRIFYIDGSPNITSVRGVIPAAGFIDFACEGDEIGVEPEPLEIFVTPPGQDKIQLYMGRAVTFELLAESVEEVVSDPYPCYARASAASPRTYDDGIWDCTLLVSPSPDVVELLWKPSTTDFEASWEFQYPFAMQLLDYSLGDLGGQVEAFGSVVTDVAGMPSGLQYDEVKSWTLRAVRRAEALPITKVGDLNPKWSSKKGGPKKSTSVWATALPYSLRLHSAVWADAFGNSITEILGGYAKGRPPKVFIKPSYPF